MDNEPLIAKGVAKSQKVAKDYKAYFKAYQELPCKIQFKKYECTKATLPKGLSLDGIFLARLFMLKITDGYDIEKAPEITKDELDELNDIIKNLQPLPETQPQSVPKS